MQAAGQFGGAVGPFLDPVSGQNVNGTVQVDYVVQAAQAVDFDALLPLLNGALLYAINLVIGQKLAAGQVAFPTLQSSLPSFQAEIFQVSGIANAGLEGVRLNVVVNIVLPTPAVAPYAGPLPPTPMEATKNAFKQAAADRLDPRNYEVKATMNVGGFKIKASSEKGIDTEGLKKQAVGKAKSAIIWWIGGCVVMAFVGLFLLGIAGFIAYEVVSSGSGGSSTKEAKAASWDGKATLTCGGNENIRVKGVTANLSSGPAVDAGANCQVLLEDVDITAPIGIAAGGNAKVTMKGGSLTGTQFATQAGGLAQVTFEGTKVTGEKQAQGGAKVKGP